MNSLQTLLSQIPKSRRAARRMLKCVLAVALAAAFLLALGGCKPGSTPVDSSSGKVEESSSNVPPENSDPAGPGTDESSEPELSESEAPEDPGDSEEPGDPSPEEPGVPDDGGSSSTGGSKEPFVPDLNFDAKKGISVLQLGAVGDGKRDDTKAFQDAFYYAQLEGLFVYVPAGTYRITEPLMMTNVTMLGYSVTDWPSDKSNLPTILIDYTDSAAVVTYSSAISGIRFKCANRVEDYPVIRCDNTTTLTNIGISDAGWAIELPDYIEGESYGNPGRSDLENISIDNVSKLGVYVSGTLDVTYMNNIRINSTHPSFKESGVGFSFWRNDGVRVSDCYVNGASVAYAFNDSTELRSTLGEYRNCAADNVKTGILVTSGAPERTAYAISIYDGKIRAEESAVKVTDGRMQLMLYNMVLESSGGPTVHLTGGENIQLNNCNVTSSSNNPAVLADGCQNTIINRCRVDAAGDGIRLTEANACAIVTNNIIQAGGTGIVDGMPNNDQKVIADNA